MLAGVLPRLRDTCILFYMNKEYAKNIRFRGEGESNKDAEDRIRRIKKEAEIGGLSFAEMVRIACDYYFESTF